MTAFIEVFDTVAEAPGGIDRLRELVLQLAVRGRLVPQDAEDESASQLLERVQLEAKDAPKSRVLVEYESEPDIAANIPSTWELVSIEDAMALVNGRAFKPGEWSTTGLPIVRIQNLNNPNAPYNHCSFSVAERFYIDTGDLLLSWSGTPGTSFGAYIWKGDRAVLNQHIFRCEPRGNAFLVPYLRLAINSRLSKMIERAHGGVGLRHITKGKLQGLILPLPPLAEQHRIVAKVDELMALIDQMETAQSSREAVRTAARDSALAVLSKSTTSEEVETAWTRIAEQMDDLFTAPADLAPLRETVLQLAVRGRLVSQDAEEEPATVLLEQIAEERTDLVKKKKIRASKPLSPVSQHEVSFEIPQNWIWIRLGSLYHLEMGQSPSSLFYNQTGEGLPFYQGKADFGDRFPTVRYWCTKPTKLADKGDVLLSVRAPIGPTNIATELCCIGRGLAALRPLAGMPTEYLLWTLRAFEEQLDDLGTGTTFKAISRKLLEPFPLPLPPLAEQHRIVAKVNELMGLIDQMEQHLSAEREYHEAFAAAAVDPHGDVAGSDIDLGVA